MSRFTHLHTASGFSVRYGASHPEQLAERAAERGMDALALTDRDSLSGAVRFAKAAAEAGIRPLFGTELAIGAPQPEPTPTTRRRTPVRGGAFIDESAPRAVFLARDGARGWATLCRLVSAAHATDRERPLLPWEALTGGTDGRATGTTTGTTDDIRRAAAHLGDPTDGVLVLLGPDSEIGRALAAGRPDRAARLLAPWRELYGDALRLEVVHHGRTGTGPGSLRLAARTLGFAVDQGIRAVLSNAVRYADPGQGPVADVLDSARRLVPIDRHRPEARDSGERWLKDADAMARTAERVAEAAGHRRDTAHRLLTMTEETAGECLVDPQDDIGLGTVHFPEPRLVGAAHRTASRVLGSRCAAGMVRRRYDRGPAARAYWERLHRELDIIDHHGFASYFLTVAQVVEDTRRLGIRVTARGSGAGSLVNHLLGIAHADPVEHGLLMERFLSKRRAVLPDIDIDVESARRLEVYRAIFDRFGAERVATVAMPETYRVRHAVRDVGAALGMDPTEVDRIAKAFPHIRARDARAALEELPELRDLRENPPPPPFWDLVEGLDALPRGMAMHPCGVLLSDATLTARTPVVPTGGEGFPMSQFDKADVEDLGLLKLDVLGVRMQSAMAHATAEIGRATGRPAPDLDDPAQVPPGDPATYGLIRSTETLGCFQIESPGQRDLIGRLQPATFHDLVVDISLFRPGPVAADMVRPFIESRHGRKPIRYPHPDLEEALRETYGVVVFHEQVIRIIDRMTDCGLDEADRIRRGLSDPESQGRIRVWFAEQAAQHGYSADDIARTWEIIEAFGSYGFCKAHAVAFAVPTYQSAWLKAHHPAAFYAGLLTHDPGMYPKRLLLADARRRGVPILPLDVNYSDVAYRIELVSGESRPTVTEPYAEPYAEPHTEPHVELNTEPHVELNVAGSGGRTARTVSRVAGSGARTARADSRVASAESRTARTGSRMPGERVAGERVVAASGVAGRWGLRLALSEVHGISEAEAERIAAGRPYTSLQDLWRRARPGRPVLERLARVGALDSFGANRRDLLLHIAELHRQQRGAPADTQLPLSAAASAPAGLPDLSDAERLSAELGVLGMDASRHLMGDHIQFLNELGVLPAKRLREARHGDTVLVAGAKAATQTPPIRSGRRVIFTTLDDSTGLVDCAFFDDSHETCAHTVFHSWLLLVRGTVQRRGPRSLSVVGTAVWNLAELAELRGRGGLRAVTAHLASHPPLPPPPTTPTPGPPSTPDPTPAPTPTPTPGSAPAPTSAPAPASASAPAYVAAGGDPGARVTGHPHSRSGSADRELYAAAEPGTAPAGPGGASTAPGGAPAAPEGVPVDPRGAATPGGVPATFAPAASAASDDSSSPDDERVIRLPTGYTLHPWADLQPAGERAATGRKLWHASPGSAG
ncbi:DNA polymerase III subunit alpha [Streptomyces sp. NPDC042319]|uniref:DNA polymerase III subunit alpha n=1 Tax=Streptomyces sp. NPDC042319 TaxID=3154332 RepID=UPI0033C1188A